LLKPKPKKLEELNEFWENNLKGKYGGSISNKQLIIEIAQKFSSSPSSIKSYIWLLKNVGLLRRSQMSKYAYDIAQTGIGEKE